MDPERKWLTFTHDVDEGDNDGIYSRVFQALIKQCASNWAVSKDDIKIRSVGDYGDWWIQLWASRLETEDEVAARLKAEHDKRKELEAKAAERAANVALAFEQSAAKMSNPAQRRLTIAPVRIVRGEETILAKIAMPITSIINAVHVSRQDVENVLIAQFPGFDDWTVGRLGESDWHLVPDPREEGHIVLVRPEDAKREAA